jgi:hypothetical protein
MSVQGSFGANIKEEDVGRKPARYISFFLFVTACAAVAALVAVLRQPRDWILVSAPWMGTLGVQRLFHVALRTGPFVWAALWAVLGMECNALILFLIRKRSFRFDRVSFAALWSLVWLGGPVVISSIVPERWPNEFLTSFPYSIAPLAVGIALAGYAAVAVATDRRHTQSPRSFALIVAVAAPCAAAILVNKYWLPDPLSSLKLTWVALVLLSLMGILLAFALLRLGAQRSEEILQILQRRSDACLRRPVLPALLLAAILAVALGSGIRFPGGAASGKRGRPNVILITVDTLRADHLGCYGYHLPTTPNLDRFAEEATLFANCISSAPMTVPAMVSMMTSQYPSHYSVGLVDGLVMRLDEPTLARTLSENGYNTVAFVNNLKLDRMTRLYGGFDIYDVGVKLFTTRSAGDTNESVVNWLTHAAREPFFLWVHYMAGCTTWIPTDAIRPSNLTSGVFPKARTPAVQRSWGSRTLKAIKGEYPCTNISKVTHPPHITKLGMMRKSHTWTSSSVSCFCGLRIWIYGTSRSWSFPPTTARPWGSIMSTSTIVLT